MGIEDVNPNPAGYEQAAPQAPVRPAPPAWADESTVAVPLSELFPDEADE